MAGGEHAGSEHLRWSARWLTRENNDEYQFRRQLANKLGQKRWLFPTYPVQYGGAGLTLDHQFVLETRNRPIRPAAGYRSFTLCASSRASVDEVRHRRAEGWIYAGHDAWRAAVWQVLTEPQGGSDVATCLPKLFATATTYVVNGQKIFVGHHLPPGLPLQTLVVHQSRQGNGTKPRLAIHSREASRRLTIRHLTY